MHIQFSELVLWSRNQGSEDKKEDLGHLDIRHILYMSCTYNCIGGRVYMGYIGYIGLYFDQAIYQDVWIYLILVPLALEGREYQQLTEVSG